MVEDVLTRPEKTLHTDTRTKRARSVRAVVMVLFFLSGACALTYEVVWMRMLTLTFGATAFATATILASFFAGLALGGVTFGRLIDKRGNPLLVYALLEVGIGLFAFLMPALLSGLTGLYVGMARSLDVGFYGLSLTRFAFSFLVLLVPATLMGGTLPVIVKYFAREHRRLGRDVGHLYAMNTLGAVTGTLAAGFFLILLLGVNQTAYAAGVVNLAIAAVAVLLASRPASRTAPSGAPPDVRAPQARSETTDAPLTVRLALWAIGVSGFCALALEVLWTRSLVFFLDNSAHAFTTILTAFLLGIGLGSVLIARFIDKRKHLLALLGVIEILIGVSAMLAIPLLSRSAPVFERMVDVPVNALLPWKWMGMRFVNSLTVMLLPTILMGMAFPVAGKLCASRAGAVGSALGNVYAANTIGGVLGSVAAGFLLIPLIGVGRGILAVAVLNVLVGGLLVLYEPGIAQRIKLAAVAGMGAVLVGVGTAVVAMRAQTLTSYYERVERPTVLAYTEGIGATVKVYRDALGDRTLSVNGFPVAGTALTMQDIQRALAHLPLLLSPVDSPRVNVIGFGAGGTSWGLMQYDVARVDVVELVPAVLDAATWFPEINHGVLDDPRFNAIRGDGRNYALVTDEVYDVISVDATSPKMAGNGSLYALEFYRLLERRLSDDGLVVQWLPYHLLSDREVRMIAKTFITVFPHATLWFTPLRQYVILVGTRAKLRIDYAALSGKLARPGVRRDLELLNVTDPIDVVNLFVMGEAALAEYVGDARVNSDDHPYLEFTPALAYFVSDLYWLRNVRRITERRESVVGSLVNVGETEDAIAVAARVERRFEATGHSIAGDVLLFQGRQEEAVVEYEKALERDPGEKNWLNMKWVHRR